MAVFGLGYDLHHLETESEELLHDFVRYIFAHEGNFVFWVAEIGHDEVTKRIIPLIKQNRQRTIRKVTIQERIYKVIDNRLLISLNLRAQALAPEMFLYRLKRIKPRLLELILLKLAMTIIVEEIWEVKEEVNDATKSVSDDLKVMESVDLYGCWKTPRFDCDSVEMTMCLLVLTFRSTNNLEI